MSLQEDNFDNFPNRINLEQLNQQAPLPEKENANYLDPVDRVFQL